MHSRRGVCNGDEIREASDRHGTGRIDSSATSNEGAKPSRVSTKPYNDTLERLWLADPVPGWAPTNGPIERLVRARKHHLADPALAAGLMRININALMDPKSAGSSPMRDGTLAGHLFESLVALNLRVYVQAADAKVYHFRTKGGEHEVDFVIERRDRTLLAVEVKPKRNIDRADTKHLHWLKEKLGDRLVDSMVITTGPDAYRRRDGVAVIPAALLGP